MQATPFLNNATQEVWRRLVDWCKRYSYFKLWKDDRRLTKDDGQWARDQAYPLGLGELEIMYTFINSTFTYTGWGLPRR